MPFSVKYGTKEGSIPRWARWLVSSAVLLIGCGLAYADGGFYQQTAHGSPKTGVHLDKSLPIAHCGQCHTSGSGKKKIVQWTANDNSLCYNCHANAQQTYPGQTGYSSAAHATSPATFNKRPVGLCVQCHNPHGAGDARGLFPHLTSRLDAQVCVTCHGSGTRPTQAVDIQTQVTKPFAHAVLNYQRLHDDAKESVSAGAGPQPRLSGAQRHVTCGDCHNPHSGRAQPRPPQSARIGEALLGSWGVRPVYTGTSWTKPGNYLIDHFDDTTHNEYTLCLKCHSGWAWGNVAPFTAEGTPETDQGLEFNPANPSFHNVSGQDPNAVPTEALVTGTATPPAYVAPWGPKSAMACTDCHAGDTTRGAVRGPHGSIYAALLTKRYAAQVNALDNTGAAGTSTDLCFTCHDWNTYGQDGKGTATNFRAQTINLHAQPSHAKFGCIACHAAVPHGFKRKHMIVYSSDGAPYFRGNALAGIQAYAPAAGGAYTLGNCTTSCHPARQNARPINPLP